MNWQSDYSFRRLAKLAWPIDYALAIVWCKGSTAAQRRMARRHEGFRAMRLLANLRAEARSIAAEIQHLGDPT